MSQIRFEEACLQFGDTPQLDHASLVIEKGDRIAILGRNGVGKSTLLTLLQGDLDLDSGNIKREAHLKVATMAQQVPQNLSGTLEDFLKAAHESEHDWETHAIDRMLSQVQLNPKDLLENLSGGQIRRALLAKALLNDPDVLLLDEPTNHLDIATIEWLEKFLKACRKTLIFVTHDRTFMQKIATRIFEIDLGKILCWTGSYEKFLAHKQHLLTTEEKAQQLFDKRLAQEEVWIRQGIKARRTRNEGRVRALKKMRTERAARLNRQGNITLQQQTKSHVGKVAFDIENISIEYESKPLIKNFSSVIMPGDKVGIIGPNGCGKTSFLNALLGESQPNLGHIKQGAQLKVAYFDQHRMQLDLEQNAIDNVGGGSDQITVDGKSKHIISYLQDFLFTPQKARSKVKMFSGGERNRLLLAKLLAKPFNVLVLDEPSNDLDMETLDLLEEYLCEYKGVLLLVSHDRTLLNNVITSSIVFEGDGKLQAYSGSYDDYLLQSKKAEKPDEKTKPKTKPQKEKLAKKLTYKEQLALKTLPKEIETTEKAIDKLQAEMAQPEFYQKDRTYTAEKQAELKALETALENRYARWEELENKQ